MAQPLRSEVLSLYKRILRLSRSWVAKQEVDTEKEKKYIYNEAKTLFRQNKSLTNEENIKKCIKEGETRYSIALHYRIPYPRPVNLPPGAHTKLKPKKEWTTTRNIII